jgi:hypothetical protein
MQRHPANGKQAFWKETSTFLSSSELSPELCSVQYVDDHVCVFRRSDIEDFGA